MKAKRNQFWVVEKLNFYDNQWEPFAGARTKSGARRLEKEKGWLRQDTRIVIYERKEGI
jgi:hypothetical protein